MKTLVSCTRPDLCLHLGGGAENSLPHPQGKGRDKVWCTRLMKTLLWLISVLLCWSVWLVAAKSDDKNDKDEGIPKDYVSPLDSLKKPEKCKYYN